MNYILREIELSDIETVNSWRSDPELIGHLLAPFRYISPETDKRWYDDYMANRASTVRCAIVAENGKLVGIVSLVDIDSLSRSAELSIMIGRSEDRLQGAGSFAVNWMTITERELQDILLKYDNSPVLQFFSNALHVLIENDLQPQNSIIYQGMDRYAEMSSGLDAKIYFDLLSYEMQQDGIYIIDQPEDNISQNAIREYLLDRFKTMGENRQVIMVTHNPQFIVNLDVDNLIFLSKKNGLFSVQSGALEYVCPEYSVLDIVAQNIDGGLDSIKKRWKRYEKTTEL